MGALETQVYRKRESHKKKQKKTEAHLKGEDSQIKNVSQICIEPFPIAQDPHVSKQQSLVHSCGYPTCKVSVVQAFRVKIPEDVMPGFKSNSDTSFVKICLGFMPHSRVRAPGYRHSKPNLT